MFQAIGITMLRTSRKISEFLETSFPTLELRPFFFCYTKTFRAVLAVYCSVSTIEEHQHLRPRVIPKNTTPGTCTQHLFIISAMTAFKQLSKYSRTSYYHVCGSIAVFSRNSHAFPQRCKNGCLFKSFVETLLLKAKRKIKAIVI